jgi:hypothetical protein
MKYAAIAAIVLTPLSAYAFDGQREVFLAPSDGARIKIADLSVSDNTYSISMNDAVFTDHFLSMRPFKCIEGPEKHWCHVPYPYENRHSLSDDFTDLEYDFLFLWKGASEYGINMWNGVYYVLEEDGDQLVGRLHEMDMDTLSAPPDPGELRPVTMKNLEPGEPESLWLPMLIVE